MCRSGSTYTTRDAGAGLMKCGPQSLFHKLIIGILQQNLECLTINLTYQIRLLTSIERPNKCPSSCEYLFCENMQINLLMTNGINC